MTTVISTDAGAAVELLVQGEVVALPTETVYGLAADAFNAVAVAKIFEAKERPRFDPLIVDLPHPDWLESLTDVPTQSATLVSKLVESFWPGPLTLLLPKRELIPDIVTAGLQTVAVRCSAHPVFAAVVSKLDRPLAAPSANRFGRISPTTAGHVFDELNGRIPLIIDGGPTLHGLESTICAIRDGRIEVLRRGPITETDLSEFAPTRVLTGQGIVAPGQLPSHYAPAKPLVLVDSANDFVATAGERVGLLAWNSTKSLVPPVAEVRALSTTQNLREAAANLFRYLRELDAQENVDLIVAERVPDQGLGAAIMDRLRRASHRGDGPAPLQ